MHRIPLDIAEQYSGNRTVLPGRRQCDRKHCGNMRAGHRYISDDQSLRNEALFQGHFLAGCAADAEIPVPDIAHHRGVQRVHETIDTDDKAFRQHACGTHHRHQPCLHNLRVRQVQCCPFRKHDGGLAALRSVHGFARSARGIPPGICIYDTVSRVHRHGKTGRSLIISIKILSANFFINSSS